jgi:hypothetical protein
MYHDAFFQDLILLTDSHWLLLHDHGLLHECGIIQHPSGCQDSQGLENGIDLKVLSGDTIGVNCISYAYGGKW